MSTRVLGINCTTSVAYLALAEDQQIASGLTERLNPPVGLEAGEALLEFVDSAQRALREMKPARVELLLPERWQATYHEHVPRATLEALIRVAAAREQVWIEILPRPTLRTRLHLSKKDKLEVHLPRAGPVVGRYWGAGRGLAALAALAGEVG